MKTNKKEEILQLIPKTQSYIEYMIETIIKLPRIERYSIGNETKESIYRMLSNILYLTKTPHDEKIKILNEIDSDLNLQRIFLRIMCKFKWIDIKKFNVAIEKIGEIGRIVGGLIKYYAKNN